jgi:hypothetical protein
MAHIDLTRAGIAVGGCGTSRHEMSSPEPFGVMLWGTDSAASYGYAAAGNSEQLSHVIVLPTVR